MNATEWADNDGDRIGDNADLDDDNDGYEDLLEVECDSDPMDLTSIPTDLDLDGTCDAVDADIDGDGYDNDVDLFPLDPSGGLVSMVIVLVIMLTWTMITT